MMEKKHHEEKKPAKEEAKEKSGKEIIDELTETLQRLQAEFENYKKRVDKEKAAFMEFAKAAFIEKLLPIVDSFELAVKNSCDHERFVKGIELIYSELYSLLEKEGVKRIESLGRRFDPFRHEALLTAESDNEDIVLEELQPGYMLNDRVLRHAKVKIGKKKEEKKEQKEGLNGAEVRV